MAALEAGILAPDFTLPTLEGHQVSLSQAAAARAGGAGVLQGELPGMPVRLSSLRAHVPGQSRTRTSPCWASRKTIRPKTADFRHEYGVNFPIAIDDDANHYAVSSAYGLTNVPTLFYIAPDGEIEVSSVGWSKRDVDEVNAKLATHRNQKPIVLWRAGESIQDFRAG